MSRRDEKNDRSLTLTRRGAVQLALGAMLLVSGVVGGWLAPGAAGIALLAGCVTGLAEVLLTRRLRTRGVWSRLVETSARVESWVRVNQRGEVIESLSRPGSRRGLYRQQSVRHTWVDAFGFWRATRVDPAARELRVPPAVSPELLRSSRAVVSRDSRTQAPSRTPPAYAPTRRATASGRSPGDRPPTTASSCPSSARVTRRRRSSWLPTRSAQARVTSWRPQRLPCSKV